MKNLTFSKVSMSLAALALLAVFGLAGCGGGGGGGSTTGDTEIPQTTKALDDSTIQNLSAISEDGSILTFSQTTTQLNSLSAGDVMVSGVTNVTPDGLLRKVGTVSKVGNQITITTVQATLEEAIKKGNISVSETLTPSNVSSAVALRKGVSLKTKMMQAQGLEGFYVAIEDVVLYDDDGNLETTNNQIRANGGISLNPSFSFNMEIDDFQLKQLTFSNTTVETAEIEVNCKVSGSLGDMLRRLRDQGRLPEGVIITESGGKVELARYTFSPITVWVGWLPIVITPVLTVYVGLDGEVSVGITTSGTQQATLTAGLSYNNGQWSPVSNFTNDFQFNPPSLSAGAKFKAYTGPQLNLLIYGVVGPYGEIKGYLELDADIFANPWWELYGGLEADIGVRVEVLSRQIVDYEYPGVIGYRKLLVQAEDLIVTPGTAPSAPTGASATAGEGQTSISWNAVSGATSYNIYWSTVSGVTKTNGTKISNATSPYTHTGRTNGTTYYYVVTAVNSYGESIESSQASATTNGTGGVSYTW